MMTRSNDRFLLERRILPSIGIAVFLFTLLATYFSYREFVLLRDLPDLFIFESAFWNTLHGRPLYNFYEFGNHLGTHFSPFLFLLVPIYALWQRPLLLIMLQALVLGSAAFPLFFIALKILGQKWAAFFVALAYLSYAPVFGAANYGFHEDAFVPLCLFWLFYAYLYNKKKLYWLFLILALGCKENVAPGLAIFGLYLAVRGEHRRIGIYTFTVSVVWFIVAVFAVMPAIKGVPVSEGMLRYRFSGEIGHSIGEIMQNFFKRPGFFFGYAFQAHKCAYLLKLFLPLVFLPLGSPIFLLAIMPALAQNLLYKYPQGTSLASQYSVQMVPYLFYGALMTIAALARLCEKRGVPGIKAQNLLAAVLLLGCIVSAFTTEVFTRSVYVRGK